MLSKLVRGAREIGNPLFFLDLLEEIGTLVMMNYADIVSSVIKELEGL